MKIRSILLFSVVFSMTLSSCQKDEEILPNKNRQNSEKPAPTTIPVTEPECPTGTAGTAVEGRFIIVMKSDNQISTSSENPVSRIRNKTVELLRKYNIGEEKIKDVYVAGITGFSGILTAENIQNLSSDPQVQRIEQDRFISLDPFTTILASDSSSQILPYGVKRIGSGAGTSKTAWILDTGIDLTHPDLNIDQARSISYVCAEPSVQDINGHGTHVAGTIAAIDNSIGVKGVAAGNLVVAVKVMGADGKGTISNLLSGLDYVYRNARPGDVVNMSLSGGASQTLDELVIKTANDKKVYFSVAAGNESVSADNLSPQKLSNPFVFTISAMDNTDTYASFSNFGTCVDYSAPGVKIVSTYPGGKYASMSGTSMAAPHVAGLLLINNGKLNKDGIVKDDPDGYPDPIAHK